MTMRTAVLGGLLVAACGTKTPSPPIAARVERSPPAAAAEPEPAPEPEIDPLPEAPAPTIRGEVVLVALGPFPDAQLDAVEAHLRKHAAVDVRRLAALELPREAWTAKRKRYRADRLLEFLLAQIPDTPPTTHILGLTQVDISTTKPPHDDWGIFGLGQMPGQSAVVSTFRLKKKARDAAQIEHRLKNTALHEVGHTFGLDHCTEALCPMQDAEGSIANTDAANDPFGPLCTAALNERFPIALVSSTGPH
jgi:archaemetzincin